MSNNTEFPTISVYELEVEQGRRLLKAANVVIGRDVMSLREFLVFGRQAVRRVAQGNQPGAVLVVELDQETDELEYLCAACQVLKGQHEYLSPANGDQTSF